MSRRVRVEIKGRDRFWGRAFHVEWGHQFPDREIIAEADYYLVEADWLADLERVAAQTFCRVLRAPEDPRRRRWLRGLAGSRD